MFRFMALGRDEPELSSSQALFSTANREANRTIGKTSTFLPEKVGNKTCKNGFKQSETSFNKNLSRYKYVAEKKQMNVFFGGNQGNHLTC